MSISQAITEELVFLFHSFLLGAAITFVYDGFIILRKLFKHTIRLISLEDLIFWMFCAILVFYVLYEENNGMLRWFAVAGASLGMLAYKKTVSLLIVAVVYKSLSFVIKLTGKLAAAVWKPFSLLLKKAGKSGRSFRKKAVVLRKYLKKKLTEGKKVLKIVIDKQ